MEHQPPPRSFDILFVGAGVSTLYTLLNLFKRLSSRPTRQDRAPLRIGIVERNSEGFGGVPYTSRSSTTALLITSLRYFLPDAERALFVDWLKQNKHWALDPFKQNGGGISASWLEAHREAIDSGDWEDLYLPRYLFGLFMDSRVRRVIATAEATGTCKVELVQGTVSDLTRIEDSFEMDLTGPARRLRAATVVLAVGSPPNHSKLVLPSGLDATGACLIDDPYEPNLTGSLDRIESFLRNSVDPSPKVLFLGASASTMDVLYTLSDRLGTIGRKIRFRVLSPCGRLPDPLEQSSLSDPFRPLALLALNQKAVRPPHPISAEDIYAAAVRDIELGQSSGLTTSDTLGPISAAVDALVRGLPLGAKKEFATTWGNAIGRLQRRAGPEYSGVAAQLASQDGLEVLEGRFRRIRSVTPEGAEVEYESDGHIERLPKPKCVIVNCAGFAKIPDLPADHLLRRIVAKDLARSTPTGTGIVVDEQLQASSGVFVLGPLLSGNVISGKPVWHLEHCGRISVFSNVLAEILDQRLAISLG